jgi:hypothetical protein
MDKKLVLIGLFGTAAPMWVNAHELETSASVGSGSYTQSLSYSRTITEPKSDESNSYYFSYSYNQAEVGAAAGATSQTYNSTHSLSGGVSNSGEWRNGIYANYSSTAAEALSSYGLSAYVGKKFNSSDDDEEESSESGFALPFSLKGSVSAQRYVQTFAASPAPRKGSKGKLPKPKAGSEAVIQFSVGAHGSVDPFTWVTVGATHTRYFYSRDIANFIAYLDDPRAIATGASQFSSTLSGFSSAETDVDLDFYLPSKVSLSIGASLSKNEETGSKTNGASLQVSRPFGKWTPSVTLQRYVSSGYSQDVYGGGLSYEF